MTNTNPRHMPKVAITIGREQLDALDRLAVERDRNRSYMVRAAISLYLAVNTVSPDISPSREDQRQAA